ncbi:MAG: polysaccharide deacetylase family protein [Verrucomicrobiota bacterium]
MKTRPWLIVPAVGALLVAACQFAHTQTSQKPQVIAVPQNEATGAAGRSAQPAQGDSTPVMQAPAPAPATGTKRSSYNSCNVEGPYIALTFDDGPHATLTPKLLDILKEKGVKATFFVLGECVAANPAVLQRAAAEGHEIGNHSWDHKALTKGGGSGVDSEINQTNAAIESATGKKPAVVRPPYGATNAAVTKRLNEEFGLKVIMWDVDPLDWKVRNAAHVKAEILKSTKAGSIILSHDIHPTTVEAMAETIDALKEKGYQFVTVSELVAMDRPLPPSTPPPAPAPAAKKKAKK